MDERPGETCILCGSSDLFHRKQTIAGDRVTVCRVCASAGRSALEAETAAGGAGEFLACLHLTACAIERELSLIGDRATSRLDRSRRRISASLNASAFVLACACSGCAKVQLVLDGGEADPSVDIFRVGGSVIMTDLAEPSLAMLRSMPNSVQCVAERKAQYVAETAVPEDQRVRLQARADAVVAPWHKAATASRDIVARVLGRRDDAARRHWLMVKRYGPGLRDGDFWLARDGAVVPLDQAERAFPMTQADHHALAVDRERAAAWRRKMAGAVPTDPFPAEATFETSLAGTCPCPSCAAQRAERAARGSG